MPGHLGGAEAVVTLGEEGLGAVGSEFHFFVGLGHFLEDSVAGGFGGGCCGWFVAGVHCCFSVVRLFALFYHGRFVLRKNLARRIKKV